MLTLVKSNYLVASNVRGVLTNDHVLHKRKGLGTTVLTFNDAHKRPNPTHKQRTAIVTLETIVWLPVLAILLAAVIEMGLLMTGTMHVAAASRLGAKLAAETAGLSSATPVNATNAAIVIRGSVNDYLENAGYGASASAGVRLQHNIGTGQSVENGTCPEQTTPALPPGPVVAFPNRPNSVRVVVCVNATEVSPNLLQTFGYNIATTTLELSTTYPYEQLP